MNQLSRNILKAICVFLCPVIVASATSAQTSSQASGRVTDKRGDAISNARVIAVAGSQTTGETKTDGAGRYTLALPPGDYELRVSADGFSAFRLCLSLKYSVCKVNITIDPD